MNHRKIQLLIVLLLTGLLGLDGWSYLAFSASKEQAVIAHQDAVTCKTLADQITALRTRPTIAGAREQADDELARRIETAVRSVGLKGDDIASIAPMPPQRVNDSTYLEKATIVTLRQAGLPQLINLLCQLTASPSTLQIKALRLTAPREKQDASNWGVEITVTYLIYSPMRGDGGGQGEIAKGGF